MARPIVIWTDTVDADFQKADPLRLALQIKKFYEGEVFIDPSSYIEDSYQIQICEILESTKETHSIKIHKDCPVIFHYTEGDFKYLANYKQLSQLGQLLHSNYSFPAGQFYNYWAYDYRLRLQFYGQELNSFNGFKKSFLCFNGRPDVHRWYVLQKLHDMNLLEQGLVSFLNRYGQLDNEIVFEEFLSLCDTGAEYAKSAYDKKELLLLDKSNDELQKNDRTHSQDLYTSTSISLITETYADDRPGCFITEKSWKAIANCHLPLWVAQPGIVDAFRNMGFDVFDDILDQTYDNILNPKDRWNAVIDSLYSYLQSDLISNDAMTQRLLNNQQKFLDLKIKEQEIISWI